MGRPLFDESTLSVIWRGKSLHLGNTLAFRLLERLARCLSDHLAASTAALELLEQLARTHPDLAPILATRRTGIEADRRELEALMARLGVTQSAARQAAAWVTEKFARLKMAVDDLSGSKLRLLESLEAVALGLHGKRSIHPPPMGYDELVARADEQRGRIEAARLDAAREALALG